MPIMPKERKQTNFQQEGIGEANSDTSWEETRGHDYTCFRRKYSQYVLKCKAQEEKYVVFSFVKKYTCHQDVHVSV